MKKKFNSKSKKLKIHFKKIINFLNKYFNFNGHSNKKVKWQQ